MLKEHEVQVPTFKQVFLIMVHSILCALIEATAEITARDRGRVDKQEIEGFAEVLARFQIFYAVASLAAQFAHLIALASHEPEKDETNKRKQLE